MWDVMNIAFATGRSIREVCNFTMEEFCYWSAYLELKRKVPDPVIMMTYDKPGRGRNR